MTNITYTSIIWITLCNSTKRSETSTSIPAKSNSPATISFLLCAFTPWRETTSVRGDDPSFPSSTSSPLLFRWQPSTKIVSVTQNIGFRQYSIPEYSIKMNIEWRLTQSVNNQFPNIIRSNIRHLDLLADVMPEDGLCPLCGSVISHPPPNPPELPLASVIPPILRCPNPFLRSLTRTRWALHQAQRERIRASLPSRYVLYSFCSWNSRHIERERDK